MMSLGEAIDSLLAYYKGRHNVHHEIKKIGSLIKKRHTEAIMLMEECEKQQTTPKKNTSKTSDVNNIRKECSGIITQSVKRTRTRVSPSTQGTGNPVVNALSPAAKNRCATAAIHQTKPVQAPIKGQNAGWTVVKPRKEKKPPKSVRTRPDAIIISKSENATYADILRKVKTSDSLKTLGEDVKAIRRTAKQELIIELKGAPHGKTSEYQTAIEDVLKTAAKVTVKAHTVTIQCRDLDEVTTAEELCDALHAQCNTKRPDTAAVRSLRTVYNGTQTAFIVLPAGDAKKVLEAQRVRIGWVSCRVRKVDSPKRCFKCWGYDHVAQKCKEQIDRSGLCRKCGQEGHKALTCKNPEQCALCKGNHAAVSYKCPLAKKARREAIQ
ncbi:uncharacterized protein LOC129250808 [Anastrepha obliqua]|uniref:uncharacterized protein LOC129250808 n=1 Tax=Anastrepha obliqua TaxID=95512 RepID=UPI002409E179|nr:uncharacterized protein LOC129250808 [Anastrepha obliqua]